MLVPINARPPWNHNVAYHPAVLAVAPSPCRRALEVGCGTGLLLAELAGRCGEVVGVDPDQAALTTAARRLGGHDNVTLLQADVLTADLPIAGFDLVTAVAVLHHLPLPAGLARLAALVRPGGRLAVVGLYRASTVGDYLTCAAAFPVASLLRQRRGHTPVDAPVQDATNTLSEIRAAARELVPGALITRRLLFRYVLTWTRPQVSQ